MRDGLGPDDQYLLLDGLGGITYSGNDAGAICEYSRYGERLLVQIEGKPDPFYQNFVSVSRGNALDPTGTFARVTRRGRPRADDDGAGRGRAAVWREGRAHAVHGARPVLPRLR